MRLSIEVPLCIVETLLTILTLLQYTCLWRTGCLEYQLGPFTKESADNMQALG